MNYKLILLTAFAMASSLQAISFREYYRGHEKEINDQVARGSLYSLYGRNLTDLDGFDEIPNLGQLQRLDLYNNQLTSIPESLGNLAQLRELILSNNQLTSIPASLGNLAKLQLLNLSNNQLMSIPASLGNLAQLRELRLFNNQLTSIPASLGNLAQLQWLFLSNNQLTSVPDSLGKLAQLQRLNLSRNQLTSVPTSLGNLAHLQWLFLTNNQLTSVPASLGNLAQLQELYLSNNPLPLNIIQLQTKLHLRLDVELYFKTLAQEQAESELINAIKAANEPAVRAAFKKIMTGEVKAPRKDKIDIATIVDDRGNNLLHIVVQEVVDRVAKIRSEITKLNNIAMSEEDEKTASEVLRQQIDAIEKRFAEIFVTLTRFGGPDVRLMMRTRNAKGNDVLEAALGGLPKNDRFVKAISEYQYKPTPKTEFLQPFPIAPYTKMSSAEETEKKEQASFAEVALPKIVDEVKRDQALKLLGLTPAQGDDPEVVETKFRKLAVQYKPSNIPPNAPLGLRTKIIEEYKALEQAKNYLLQAAPKR